MLLGIPERDDIKMVNCARCKEELLGESNKDWYDNLPLEDRAKSRLPDMAGGRIADRPYCEACYEFVCYTQLDNPRPRGGRRCGQEIYEDFNPGNENAIRAWEDQGD